MTTLASLTIQDLSTLYNRHAGDKVERFSSKSEALERVTQLAAELDLEIVEQDNIPVLVPRGEHTKSAEDDSVAQVIDNAAKEDPDEHAKTGAPASETSPQRTVRHRQPRHRIDDAAVVAVLVASNPKKPGSDSEVRFCLYTPGITVRAYTEAAAVLQGGKPERYRADISWDLTRGYIALLPPR